MSEQNNIDRQKAIESEIDRRVNQWMLETEYPKEFIPNNFPDMVWACFRFNSAFDLRMTSELYKSLTEKTEGYTYMDISNIGLVCKKRNAYELSMDKDAFNEFQMAVEGIVRELMKRTTEQKEAIAKNLIVDLRTEQSVPAGKKTIKFPMAQA